MRLNHAQRRALRLLDRGQPQAFLGLKPAIREHLERLGLVDPSTPAIITPAGREAANVSIRNFDSDGLADP